MGLTHELKTILNVQKTRLWSLQRLGGSIPLGLLSLSNERLEKDCATTRPRQFDGSHFKRGRLVWEVGFYSIGISLLSHSRENQDTKIR